MNKHQCMRCWHFRPMLKEEKETYESGLFDKRVSFFCNNPKNKQDAFLIPINKIQFCPMANNGRGGTNVR